MEKTDSAMTENSRAREAIPMTPKVFGGSLLVAGSHVKRTPMRISFGPPSSSDGSDSDDDSENSGGDSPCTGAAAGDGRPMSLTERLQARRKTEGLKDSKMQAPELPSEGSGGRFSDLSCSSQVHVAASKMARLSVSASSGTTKARTPLRSVGNIENNKLDVSRSPFDKRNGRSDGKFEGEGWGSSPAAQLTSISPPPLERQAVEHGSNDDEYSSDLCNDRAGVACRSAPANAIDNSVDLSEASEQEEREGDTTMSHRHARAGREGNSGDIDRGGSGRRRRCSPQMDQTAESMDDSINLTDTSAADETSECHRSLKDQFRNKNRVAPAVASAATSAVPATSQSSQRARGRYSVASSVASSVDLSQDDCAQTIPGNSASSDSFDSASCYRNDDGYHSSASSWSSKGDSSSISKNPSRRYDPNHSGSDGESVSGSSSSAGVATNARRSGSTKTVGGGGAAAACVAVGSDFSDGSGSGSDDDTHNFPSNLSLISAPRVSMGAAGAAARGGGGSSGDGRCDGGRYQQSEGDCEWQPAADDSHLWELQANGERGTAFSVPANLYDRMYAHQREGVKWLWQLHQGGVGGILGDDMGLGKTFQVLETRRNQHCFY